MCGCRKWLRAQGGLYAEVGLINHNTTTEERERERGPECPIRPNMNNIHARAGLRRLEVVNWGEGLLHVAFMLVCFLLFGPFFLLSPSSKGGESLKET
jgi:hypothetical protein